MVLLSPPHLTLASATQDVVDEERRKEGRMPEKEYSNGANGANGASSNGRRRAADTMRSPFSPYRVRVDLPDLLSKELRDL